ncbi:MAG: eukaryotic glutathione synthase [Olpidium bornovanus]|uniref:Eukaryotic glutathione synthase n=1 Tax=Olpidium bornovanus TaxID=278681 RepID=A0A8H7ZML2_9FUNG|nr:MAG: eukaryotic glutathione synthase [Olpidium bornovanus]
MTVMSSGNSWKICVQEMDRVEVGGKEGGAAIWGKGRHAMGEGERVACRQQPYPPKLREPDASALRERAVHWALSHGLVYRPARDPPVPCPEATVTHAPVALFPTPFPERAFLQAVGLQPLFNQLVHSVSLDREFVADVMDR